MDSETKGAWRGLLKDKWVVFLLLSLTFCSLVNADESLLYRCNCTGICHGREITAQAVELISMYPDGGVEESCCDTCKEIWAQLCGGYANCRQDCEYCCESWCSGIGNFDSAYYQCNSVCIGGCESFRYVNNILGLLSTVSVVLAAVFFALHALALMTSFGPYERSDAKRSIKYVIIVLILLALVVNIVNVLFFPFSSPGGATTHPECEGVGIGSGGGDIVIPDDGIPLVDGDFHDGGRVPGGSDVYVDGGTPVYYKFVCCINDESHPIQIIGTPYSNSGGARCVVLKRGSPPTVEEIEYMQSHAGFDGNNWQQISRNPTVWGWVVPKPAGYEDSYIRCSTGYTGIMLEVPKPTPKSLWYAAFYSPEDTVLGHISITCSTPLSECEDAGSDSGETCPLDPDMPSIDEIPEITTPISMDPVTIPASGGRGDRIYYKFNTKLLGSSDPSRIGIQASITSESTSPHTDHVIIKRGCPPTAADVASTYGKSPDLSGEGGLYWNYNVGPPGERVQVDDGPAPEETYYVMFFNCGDEEVKGHYSISFQDQTQHLPEEVNGAYSKRNNDLIGNSICEGGGSGGGSPIGCMDGTPFGECSTNKPAYCDSTGSLLEDYCFGPDGIVGSGDDCGCPVPLSCQADGRCLIGEPPSIP